MLAISGRPGSTSAELTAPVEPCAHFLDFLRKMSVETGIIDGKMDTKLSVSNADSVVGHPLRTYILNHSDSLLSAGVSSKEGHSYQTSE